MDVTGKDTILETEKGSEDPGNYHASNLSSDWKVNGNNLTNTSIEMIPMGNSMVESSACSSTSMVDSFCPPIWDQPVNGQNLNYNDLNVQNDASTFSSLASVRANIGWTPNQMSRGGMFLPAVHGMLPQSLSHFPADSAFIERAARFSCFSGGNFGEMMSSISIPDLLNPYSQGLASMQGIHEVLGGDGSKSFRGLQSHRHEMNVANGSKEASFMVKHGTEVNQLKNKEKGRSFHDEAKHGADVSANESDEAEVNSRGSQEKLEGVAGESFGKGLGSKKRKRTVQNIERNETNEVPQPSVETEKDGAEIKQKRDHNPTSTNKAGGKHGKQGSQLSDTPKEEYIHVRARRGQATNSHSLAERVRREKISERMKYLQDLVPGCSKVTGKAVMLDEIINYVQSLQRQVEFLSMKLATVNHRMDFNIEEFLAKDILQPRAGLSSSLAFLPDMTLPYPPLHPSQPGLTQASIPGLGNSSYAIGRTINLQSTAVGGGFKESTSQVPGTWEDELRDVVHMGFNSSSPIDRHDLSDSLPLGHMKAEP